jgi:putative transcriptional regulator
MTYHYKESGLDNIWLQNGYTIHTTPYGEGVSIHATEQLHKVITLWLVKTPKRITGAELRFIRMEMELTQRHLAGMLGTEEQNLRRWEKSRNRPIPGSADHLLRALANEYAEGDGSVRALVNRLAELDQVECGGATLAETPNGWAVTGMAEPETAEDACAD